MGKRGIVPMVLRRNKSEPGRISTWNIVSHPVDPDSDGRVETTARGDRDKSRSERKTYRTRRNINSKRQKSKLET